MFYGRHPHEMGDGGIGLLGWLIPVLILAALVGLIVFFLIRSRSGPPAGAPINFAGRGGLDPAIEQARFRYARGEISRDDYFRIASDLGGPAFAPAPPPWASTSPSPPPAPEPPPLASEPPAASPPPNPEPPPQS
jgi:uncharacterized membrane protein